MGLKTCFWASIPDIASTVVKGFEGKARERRGKTFRLAVAV
jgi:hypothetical protein